LAAAVYLGALGGALLGAIGGGVILTATILTFHGSEFGDTEGLFALVVATVIGTLVGLMVGALNGVVIVSLVHIWQQRSAHGIDRTRVAVAATATTLVGGLAILGLVMHGMGVMFICCPAVAAALLAWPMSRRLPLTHN
jgi:hypothetical protein